MQRRWPGAEFEGYGGESSDQSEGRGVRAGNDVEAAARWALLAE